MKTLFGLLVALVSFSPSALAVSPAETEVQFQLNRGSAAMQRTQLGTQVIRRSQRMLRCNYDFSRDGGAVGSTNLKDSETGQDCKLPSKAIITQVLLHVITGVTSGGAATATITANSAGDLLNAAAKTTIDVADEMSAGIPVGTAATSVVLTAERTMVWAIGTATFTAGKVEVFFFYMLGAAS